MTGVWCLIGYTIANLPFIKDKLEHYKGSHLFRLCLCRLVFMYCGKVALYNAFIMNIASRESVGIPAFLSSLMGLACYEIKSVINSLESNFLQEK